MQGRVPAVTVPHVPRMLPGKCSAWTGLPIGYRPVGVLCGPLNARYLLEGGPKAHHAGMQLTSIDFIALAAAAALLYLAIRMAARNCGALDHEQRTYLK